MPAFVASGNPHRAPSSNPFCKHRNSRFRLIQCDVVPSKFKQCRDRFESAHSSSSHIYEIDCVVTNICTDVQDNLVFNLRVVVSMFDDDANSIRNPPRYAEL